MTNNDAIRAMQFYKPKLSNGIFNQYIEAFDVAIDALREKGATVEWISVEERLPDNQDHDWVLAQVVEESGYMHIPRVMEYRQNRNDWFEGTYGWLSDHDGEFRVTHWMPLPPPPEK